MIHCVTIIGLQFLEPHRSDRWFAISGLRTAGLMIKKLGRIVVCSDSEVTVSDRLEEVSKVKAGWHFSFLVLFLKQHIVPQ